MTRILMSLDAVGGVWRYAMELAAALRPFGCEVVFAGLGPRPGAAQEDEARRIGTLHWLDLPLDWMVDGEDELAEVPQALAELAAAEGADLLHLNLPSQAAGIRTDLPVVTVSHSCLATWWECMRGGPLPADWLWQKELNARGFARADAVVAPSRSHANALRRCFGRVGAVEVVHNGMAGTIAERAKEPFVFAAGRWWDEGKNGAVLDEAAGRCTWPVVMAGATLSPIGQQMSLRHARPAGALDHDAILENMARAAIVVSPSLYEPFGLAALEGARAGAALVLADIPTYRELWEGAAVFFKGDDAAALAAKIDELAADPQRRAELGSGALERSRRYRPELQGAAMSEIYARLARPAIAAA